MITHTIMATFELLTNEWLRADGNKWIGRKVLCHFSDNREDVCVWNGFYWIDQQGQRVTETIKHHILAFYVYEKYNENDII